VDECRFDIEPPAEDEDEYFSKKAMDDMKAAEEKIDTLLENIKLLSKRGARYIVPDLAFSEVQEAKVALESGCSSALALGDAMPWDVHSSDKLVDPDRPYQGNLMCGDQMTIDLCNTIMDDVRAADHDTRIYGQVSCC